MFKNILLLATTIFLFSACGKDESIQESLVGEWEFSNYHEYTYCSPCPYPKEIINNVGYAVITNTLYKNIIFLADGQVRLYLNHPNYLAKEEEHRGNYVIKSDSIFFNLKEVYFDGKKQTITSNPHLYPELDYTLSEEYLKGKTFNFKFSVQNDNLEIYQKDYDRQIETDWIDQNGVKYTQLGRIAKTEKVTYQLK